MIPRHILDKIEQDNFLFSTCERNDFFVPDYDPLNHYVELTRNKYFVALLYLRSHIKIISDYYFGILIGARNVDLFMLTPSVSSPMGPGSDSQAIPIKLGEVSSYLVDSAQFGFEPLLLNDFDKVYCYMPSMRGEDCDKRHLNQFFHCEMEMRGELGDVKRIAEGYIRIMCEALLYIPDIIRLISTNYLKTIEVLNRVVQTKKFKEISFDTAVKVLEDHGKAGLINYTKHGRDISSNGEIELLKCLGSEVPLWINNFDRDRVPFYQKPSSDNKDKTINADFLFPPLQEGSFGGEVAGSGQRQDNVGEMYQSLKRQSINTEPYEWYINLRRQKNYNISSGFGLGIERFISWALGFDDIKKAIIYPRLKNKITYP